MQSSITNLISFFGSYYSKLATSVALKSNLAAVDSSAVQNLQTQFQEANIDITGYYQNLVSNYNEAYTNLTLNLIDSKLTDEISLKKDQLAEIKKYLLTKKTEIQNSKILGIF
jgi:hypothetical protein